MHDKSEQFIQGLFSHILAYSQPCVTLMLKPHIFGILEYSKPVHNCVPTHIQNFALFTNIGIPHVTLEIQDPVILTIVDYSEP